MATFKMGGGLGSLDAVLMNCSILLFFLIHTFWKTEFTEILSRLHDAVMDSGLLKIIYLVTFLLCSL